MPNYVVAVARPRIPEPLDRIREACRVRQGRQQKGMLVPAFEAAAITLGAPDAVRNRVMPTSPIRLHVPSMTLS
jgi:hypothetical protein